MEPVVSLVALLGALALGAMSPGPSFVLVARTAIARSRADGLAAALGMGIGGVIFAVLVVLGLQAALRHVPALYLVLKVAGGIYLFYLGIRIWRGATEPLAITDPGERMKSSLGSSFLVALGTQLSPASPSPPNRCARREAWRRAPSAYARDALRATRG